MFILIALPIELHTLIIMYEQVLTAVFFYFWFLLLELFFMGKGGPTFSIRPVPTNSCERA